MIAALLTIAFPREIFLFVAGAVLATLVINDAGPPRGPRGGGMHDQW